MKLFDTVRVGDLQLPNRFVMAPLTRNRSTQPGDIPNALNAEYYAQRASAGLIISEATQVSPMGKGYVATPGIHSEQQVEGWKLVTDAVHDAGGLIALQLWHVGRISHVDLLPEGEKPLAPTNVRANAQTFKDATGPVDVSQPRALDVSEISGVVEEFRVAAENAKAAGFDMVEIHGANGYLLDQFTCDGVNTRSDAYGGSIQNRLRFPLEVVRAVVDVWGAGKVGYRVSPTGVFNDMSDSDPKAHFTVLAAELGKLGLAYLHGVEAFGESERDDVLIAAVKDAFQNAGGGAYMANGAYVGETAEARVASGQADLVSFGQAFLANPDLPERVRQGAAFNEPNRDAFYGGTEAGYTDYPTLEQVKPTV